MAFTLQTCQGQETQKSNNFSRSKETKDTWQLNAMCDPVLDPGTEKMFFFCGKGHKWDNWWNLNKVCRLDNGNVINVILSDFYPCTVITEETYLAFRKHTLKYLEVEWHLLCSLPPNV